MYPPDQRYFFVHVMKTGGATFRRHVYANFGDDEVFPDSRLDGDMRDANMDIEHLLTLPEERRAKIRAYTGHFPFVVTDLMNEDLVTLTILREPVSRTVSYLKHCKRHHKQHQHLTLDEIYDDPFFFPSFIHNHQAKVFSMTPDDKLESYMDVIEIDDERLETARRNIERVDVLGLNEHHAEFLAEVEERLGWEIKAVPDQRVSEEPWVASDDLRQRIAHDNAADLEFYEDVRSEYRRRRSRTNT